jgi:hypothetical protein
MKKDLLKMALLAFATFAASEVSAQSTYVLYGNVGEGEVKLSTTRDQANDGPMTVSDYSENGQVVGFTQTITGQGNWFLSYDWFGSEIDPVILKGTEYNLVYDVRTSWSGDVKLKFEVQTKGATEKPVSFDHDGEWHTITIPVQSWVDANVLQTIESSSRVMFGFVGGNWNVKDPTTIDYRNVKLVPVNVVSDNEVPTWVSEPTVVASPTTATISVNAKDNISTILKYEVSKTADFATLEATVSGKANEATEIALKGLSQKTDYTYYVRVKDMAGNVGDVKTVTFTTTEAPALEEVTYYGIAGGSDEANWIDKVDGYFPTIEYSATTTAYNQMAFKIKLSEIGEGLTTPELWCDQLPAGHVGMTKVEGTTNEFTATLFDENAKARGDQINFRFRFPMTGGAPMTQNIYMKVGDSNAKPSEDTTAPTWGSDPVAQNVTDKTAEIVVNVTDDSGSAVITLTGDNGFVELKKEVKADGTDQTIALNGLTANTDYNLTLAIADAANNDGESKTVKFTTLEAPDLDVLYHSFNFTSENWTKHNQGGSNTFAPNGRLLLTVNADNTVTVKVTVDEGAETVDNAWVILHGIENFRINAQEDGSFVGSSTKSISNRDASQIFHLNFVLKNGVGNSELYKDGMSFTPSEGSTSAVAEVEAEAAKVVAANGVIRVEGDKTFAVYTVAGQLAFRGMGEVRLDKGVYVVVVDGKAQKVML